MSHYMVCRSDHNLDYYPNNTPCNFKVKLRQTVELNRTWTIALAELHLKEANAKEETLYIYSDVCGESFINGVKVPLLRRVVVLNNSNSIFAPCYYVPVIKSEVSEFEFQLRTERGQLASHIKNPVTLVLHLTSI